MRIVKLPTGTGSVYVNPDQVWFFVPIQGGCRIYFGSSGDGVSRNSVAVTTDPERLAETLANN